MTHLTDYSILDPTLASVTFFQSFPHFFPLPRPLPPILLDSKCQHCLGITFSWFFYTLFQLTPRWRSLPNSPLIPWSSHPSLGPSYHPYNNISRILISSPVPKAVPDRFLNPNQLYPLKKTFLSIPSQAQKWQLHSPSLQSWNSTWVIHALMPYMLRELYAEKNQNLNCFRDQNYLLWELLI